MKIYYLGTEIPKWRTLLHDQGVYNVGLSFVGLSRRTKFTKPYLLSEKFQPEDRIFLDSGTFTFNNSESQYSIGEIKDLYVKYQQFVLDNIDAVTMVSEFDALALGVDWIKGQREDFWSDIPEDKFLPIWHPNLGIDELDYLCSNYSRVGVPSTALGEINLSSTLNRYVQTYGVKLHGMAMTKPAEMKEIKWDSVASTSWISPAQFGDTIVWTGRELKRYPKAYKEQGRKRHRVLFEENGFDSEKIEAGNTDELLKLSIWSWRQVENNINHDEVATTSEVSPNTLSADNGGGAVDNLPENSRNNVPTRIRDNSERKLLPILGMQTQNEKYTDEEGNEQTREIPLITSRSQSLRICDTCFLKKKCPGFESGSNCVYDIPVQVRTKDQFKALFDAIVEMQSQRVMFAKMAEDMEGGYPDPNLSGEIKLLTTLMEKKASLEQEGFSIHIEGRSNSSGGLARLLGRDAHEKLQALPAPISGDDAVSEIIEVEVLSDLNDLESSN